MIIKSRYLAEYPVSSGAQAEVEAEIGPHRSD